MTKAPGLLLLTLLLLLAGRGGAETWYRSNAAGMALEPVESRLAALRLEFCLAVTEVSLEELPYYAQEYYESGYVPELRILYEKKVPLRNQWILRDSAGTVRLVASLKQPEAAPKPPEAAQTDTVQERDMTLMEPSETAGREAGSRLKQPEAAAETGIVRARDMTLMEPSETAETGIVRERDMTLMEPSETAGREAGSRLKQPEAATGFIEVYDEYHLITSERRFSPDGSETVIDYFYNRQVLLRVETRRKTAPDTPPNDADADAQAGANTGDAAPVPLTTDYYRYSRSNALRSVERVYHPTGGDANETAAAGGPAVTRLGFPQLGLTDRVDEHFISPGTAYRSAFPPPQTDGRVAYTTDQRGKVLTETRESAEGEVQGEIRNTWDGNRLKAVEWKSGAEEWRSEYEYNGAGDRLVERNYRNGVLERVVREENGREIEELYMNGRLILRAVWENGRKISEERL